MPEYNEDKKKKKVDTAAIEAMAIAIVDDERKKWTDAVSFVTDRVAFQMRNLIRNLRKNYWGVYDIPNDPLTGRAKVWVPLTRTLVDGSTKNIDLDSKDVNFRAKNDKGYAITKLIRALVRKFLGSIYFGEILDESERTMAIDGTIVWKTYEGRDGNGKVTAVRKNVDLLNVYIDPTEDNIQTAFRFTERSIMLPSEIEAMTGWINRVDLTGSTNTSRIDGQYQNVSTGTTAKYRDVWEMWGKIPRYFITGDKSNDDSQDDLIDGHIVVSGLEVREPRCHLIEENTKKDEFGNAIKPYEECRYTKISNRWYGLGIAERVLMLQIWLNTIVNIRINRSFVSQLGLFKIAKGSGITPQMLSRLGANGAIVVNQMTDIEQFQVDEASEASYTDEQKILDWAQRDTGAFDVSVGEPTPASKPATTSVIENNSAKSGFKMVKDNIGSFLERWVDRHVLPILAKSIDVGEMIEVSDSDDIEALADEIVAVEAKALLEKMKTERGIIPTARVMQEEINIAKQKIAKRPNIFIKIIQKLVAKHVYTKVFVTNEEMDPAVMVQNLLSTLKFVPQEAQMPIVKEAMDLMGLDFNIPKPEPQPQPQADIKQAINFKDLPPDGQMQMAAEAGIKLGGGQIRQSNPQVPQGVMPAMTNGMTGVQQVTNANTLK